VTPITSDVNQVFSVTLHLHNSPADWVRAELFNLWCRTHRCGWENPLVGMTTAAILRGGAGWATEPPDFLLASCLATPIFCFISSSFDWLGLQQITFSQLNFERFEDFLATVLTIFLSLWWV